MQLQPHQQRVVEEAEQLDDRIAKLQSFLDSEKSANVDGHERTLLGSQLQAMRTYSSFLHARMYYWNLLAQQAAEREPNPEPCPCSERMGEHACSNRHQCWEPCGELGKSSEHVAVVDAPTHE